MKQFKERCNWSNVSAFNIPLDPMRVHLSAMAPGYPVENIETIHQQQTELANLHNNYHNIPIARYQTLIETKPVSISVDTGTKRTN